MKGERGSQGALSIFMTGQLFKQSYMKVDKKFTVKSQMPKSIFFLFIYFLIASMIPTVVLHFYVI